MKDCIKCGITKPLSEFYKHSRMKDGHLGKCKECARLDSRTNREKNLERVMEYDRNRPNKAERNEALKKSHKERWRSDESFRESVKASKRKWVINNPLKRKAQNAANSALKSGLLVRKTRCESCGEDKPLHKHHESYEEAHWLIVVWLCSQCHKDAHKRSE